MPQLPDFVAIVLEKSTVTVSVRRQHGSLTRREDEVLQWIAAGKSNREMAQIMTISPGTISKHLEHIFHKLGVENRTSAASFYEAETALTASSPRAAAPPPTTTKNHARSRRAYDLLDQEQRSN
jgi:DNA-binding CsgD family transcriptional regulator